MADQKDKKPLDPTRAIKDAIEEVAQTESGRTFLRYLAERCYFTRSTIVGDPQTYEVNPLGSIAQEFQRRLYLDIRRAIPKAIRQKIEE